MTLVTDSIAADIATLERVVDAPTGELGYGTDLWCVNDVTAALDEVDPFSTLAIAQATLRRLTTPRGALADDQNYGLDIRGYLNRGTPIAELRDLQGQIRSEVRKDDRVDDADVIASYASTSELTIAVKISPADPRLSVFALTISVTNGQALLSSIT